jgi:hypothetical protein
MFSKEDFEDPDTVEKLRLIVMSDLKFPLMQNFHALDWKSKERFNYALNKYIVELPEDWENIVDADFSSVCKNKLFTDEFKAANETPKAMINTMETAEVLDPVE